MHIWFGNFPPMSLKYYIYYRCRAFDCKTYMCNGLEKDFCYIRGRFHSRYDSYLSRNMTKPTKWPVRPAKTQIIHPVSSESSLSARRKLGPLATHWAHGEDSDQTWRMFRLIWVFAGRSHFVGFIVRRFILHGKNKVYPNFSSQIICSCPYTSILYFFYSK